MTSVDKPNKINDPEAFYVWLYRGMKRFLSITVLEIGESHTKYIAVPDHKNHNVKKGNKSANAIWIDKERLLHLLTNTKEYDNKNILVVTFEGDIIRNEFF